MAFTTRQSLVRGAQANDDKRWEEFYEFYRGYVMMMISQWQFSNDEKENIVQNVMIEFHKRNNPVEFSMRAGTYDFEYVTPSGRRASFRTWLRYLIRTEAQKVYRDRCRHAADVEFIAETDVDIPDFESKYNQVRAKFIARKALDLLTKSRTNKRNIEAFQMVLNGKKPADVARELGMTEDSVYQAISRCRKSLAEHKNLLKQEL